MSPNGTIEVSSAEHPFWKSGKWWLSVGWLVWAYTILVTTNIGDSLVAVLAIGAGVVGAGFAANVWNTQKALETKKVTTLMNATATENIKVEGKVAA